LSGARVLAVDDDPLVRGLIVRVLKSGRCAVSDAGDVSTAIDLLQAEARPVDLLVTDCAMPGLPARKLVDLYRARNPDGHVLMCSGFAPEESAQLLRIADGYLQKPFSSEALLKAAGVLLSKESPVVNATR